MRGQGIREDGTGTMTRLLHESKTCHSPAFAGAGSANPRHSRESGNPETFMIEVDSRFLPAFAGMTGNDGLSPRE